VGDEMFKKRVNGNERKTREGKGGVGQRREWIGMQGNGIGLECNIYLLLFMNVVYVQYVVIKHLQASLSRLNTELQQWQGHCTGACP